MDDYSKVSYDFRVMWSGLAGFPGDLVLNSLN